MIGVDNLEVGNFGGPEGSSQLTLVIVEPWLILTRVDNNNHQNYTFAMSLHHSCNPILSQPSLRIIHAIEDRE